MNFIWCHSCSGPLFYVGGIQFFPRQASYSAVSSRRLGNLFFKNAAIFCIGESIFIDHCGIFAVKSFFVASEKNQHYFYGGIK
jgi:hypothetical protein